MPIPVLGQEMELEKAIHDIESQLSIKFHELGKKEESQIHFDNQRSTFHKIQTIKRARILRLELLFLQKSKSSHESNNLLRHNRGSV
jgi:hypothetical protein